MTDIENDTDYWVGSPESVGEQPNSNTSETILVRNLGIVEPLPADMVLRAGRNTPDSLAEHLFPPANDETSPVKTYALLDAGKMSNLPEVLDTSGLDHGCLYRGQTFEELGDLAPWLVELDADHSFTRQLFLCNPEKPDAFQLWKADLGVFVVSPDNLEDLIAHFRKFTIVEDTNGARFFFRFWESVTWDALVDTTPDEMDFVSALLSKHRVIFRSATSFAEGRFFGIERGQG